MKNRSKTFRIITLSFWLIVTIVPVIGIIVSIVDPIHFYSVQDEYRQFLDRYGRFAPTVFIFLQILQVVITPQGRMYWEVPQLSL